MCLLFVLCLRHDANQVCVRWRSRARFFIFSLFELRAALRSGYKVCMSWAAAVAYTLIVSSFLSMRDARSDLVDDRFGSLSTRYHVNWFFCLTRFFPIFSSSPSANVFMPTGNVRLRQLRECFARELQKTRTNELMHSSVARTRCTPTTLANGHKDESNVWISAGSSTDAYMQALDSPHRFDIRCTSVRSLIKSSNARIKDAMASKSTHARAIYARLNNPNHICVRSITINGRWMCGKVPFECIKAWIFHRCLHFNYKLVDWRSCTAVADIATHFRLDSQKKFIAIDGLSFVVDAFARCHRRLYSWRCDGHKSNPNTFMRVFSPSFAVKNSHMVGSRAPWHEWHSKL